MTIYYGDVEDHTKTDDGAHPKSAPRRTGYLIRKRIKQKGEHQPKEEYYVTFNGSPIVVYVPNNPSGVSDRNVGNPYLTMDQAKLAIRIHKNMNAKTVILSEEFFDENLNPVSQVVVPVSKPDSVIAPCHKPAQDSVDNPSLLVNFAHWVFGVGTGVMLMHFLK